MRRAFIGGLGLVVLGCGSNGTASSTEVPDASPAPASSDPAALVLGAMREMVAKDGVSSFQLMPVAEARGFRVDGGTLVPRLERALVGVRLPARADGAFVLEKDGARIEVGVEGARPALGVPSGGAVVYEGAFGGGALAHVPTASGTEEFVLFKARPERREIRYRLKPNGGALRLVNGVLEVLDGSGSPRFHTTAPTVVDDRGRARLGTIEVTGCAVDRSDAAPWGRPTVAPGADVCVVTTSWDDTGLQYPLMVDPAWTDAGSLAVKRQYHSAAAFVNAAYTACNSGCVLVTGGRGASPGYVSTVELFSESSGTWASVAAIPGGGRQRGSSAPTWDGRVLVAGGYNSGQLDDSQTYDPSATPAWKVHGSLPGGALERLGLVGIRIQSGSANTGVVVAVGGYNGIDSVKSMGIFNISSNSWGTGPNLSAARYGAAVAGWNDDCALPCTSRWRVVTAGGVDAGLGAAIGGVEVYSSTTGAWASGGTLPSPRRDVAAVELDDRVLFAGGNEIGVVSNSIEQMLKSAVGTTTKLTASLGTARLSAFGAAYGPSGSKRAVFVGGYTSPTSAAGSEAAKADLVTAGGTVFSMNTLTARAEHATVRLNSGNVLVIGGVNTSGSTTTFLNNELFAPMANGAACSAASDCASLNCVDGYCCNTSCTEQCGACNVAGKLGTCSAVTGAPRGSRTACSGFGTTCGSQCDGTTLASCTFAASSTICAAASCATATEKLPPSYCSGSGSCIPATKVSCGTYKCDSTTSACKIECASATDCATGYTCKDKACKTTGGLGTLCDVTADCASGTFCTASEGVTKVCCGVATCGAGEYCAPTSLPAKVGTCVKGLGSTCSTSAECGSGFCVDGVCCDTACDGQCEACDGSGASKGKCTAVKGEVHGSRAACSTGGGDVCRALACDGTDRLKCAAFKSGLDVECTAASCKAGVETPAAYCDGAGSCKAGATRPCAPFVCGDKACKKTCVSNADCTKGNVCDTTTSQCVPSKATCTTDGTASQPADGTGAAKPCSPYLCNPSTGDCYGECNTAGQCAAGFACDGNRCVPGAVPAAEDSGGCGCTTAGREQPAGTLLGAIALGLIAGFCRRRQQ